MNRSVDAVTPPPAEEDARQEEDKRQGAHPAYAIVVPTLGRPSLQALLERLADQQTAPAEVLVVDDRSEPGPALAVPSRLVARTGVRVLRSFGRGPATARNLGWRVAAAEWVVFLDDDVVPGQEWAVDLMADLAGAADHVAAVQGRITVPLPTHRRPTDWERNVAGLESAAWITADLACRRQALEQVHGLDERFRRAYREDADLALRLRKAGWTLTRGTRHSEHPVRPARALVSLGSQRGAADDALMRRLHGRRWRTASDAGHGRMPWHVMTCAAAASAVVGVGLRAVTGPADGRGSEPPHAGAVAGRVGVAAGAVWAALTADFGARRILPGPRTPREVGAMLVTSIVIPPLAVVHRLRGEWTHRTAGPWPVPVQAVVFDRDGTLVEDVPYNGDPSRVRPVDGARVALDRLRRHGIRLAIATNQSGVAGGLVSPAQVDAVNRAVTAAVGPIDSWHVCPHAPEDGCECRKPRPGLVRAAAASLGVSTLECAFIGDIGSDLEAARAAGAAGILVPNPRTRPHEVDEAPVVAPDLGAAVDLVLSGRVR